MRRLKCVAVVLVTIALLFCVFFDASGASSSVINALYDESEIYLSETDGNTVTVRSIKNSSSYRYAFDNMLTNCVSDGKLYAVLRTNQTGVLTVKAMSKGKLVGETVVKSNYISDSTTMRVDNSGRFYFLVNSGSVEVFDSDGKLIKKLSNSYYSLFENNDKIYALSRYGLYRLKGADENKIRDYEISKDSYCAGENFLAEVSGYVYNLNTGERLPTQSTQKRYTTCVSSNYVICLKNNTISLYNKSDGAFVNSTKLSSSCDMVLAQDSKVYTIKTSDYSVKTHKEKNFLPKASTKSDNNSSSGINFGKYKVVQNCVYLLLGTTRSEFRNEVSFDGYKLKFSKSSGLGTGTKAVCTKDGNSYVYKIIVKGDITGTGRVTSTDVNIMFNCLFGLDKVGGIYKKAADMNGDNKLSNVDLVMLDRKIN